MRREAPLQGWRQEFKFLGKRNPVRALFCLWFLNDFSNLYVYIVPQSIEHSDHTSHSLGKLRSDGALRPPRKISPLRGKSILLVGSGRKFRDRRRLSQPLLQVCF